MNGVFKKDLYRYYGSDGETLAKRLVRPPELKYLALFREAQSCTFAPLKLFLTFRLKRMSAKTHIQIPVRTRIGEGFYIGHSGRVVINPDAVIGRNVNVAAGVVIGAENRGKRKGAPTVSDCCWIGSNAVVVGKINVGEDVLIAPLSFVNFDVPPHSVVVGNPGRIIPKENAVDSYVCNRV